MSERREEGKKQTGRRCRAAVVSGSRSSLRHALGEVSGDLEAAAQALLYRLGTDGSVDDDVLGWAPDRPAGRVRVQTGGADQRHRGLRRSVEFLESQPWLPDSVRHLAEAVLQAIGRSPVRPLGRVAPWPALCAWAAPLRRDEPGRLRMARRGVELLTGTWPWGTAWVDVSQPAPAWVDAALGRDRRVMLDYAPLTKCGCDACVSRRLEVAEARQRYQE